MTDNGWTFVPESQIKNIKYPITVFLRDPKQRFYSGVNTFLQHMAKENLDSRTVLYFVNRYLFLNRHYAPQFFWLLNLARFAGTNMQVTFHDMKEISNLTAIHSHADVEPLTQQVKSIIDSFDWHKLELYMYLDQILIDHIGKTICLQDLIQHVQTNHKNLYELVFQNTLDIIDVLPKT